MRLLLPLILALCLMLGLTACPSDETRSNRPQANQSKPEQEASKALDQEGQKAISYLKASLADPANADHASFEDCWSIISRLPDASPFARDIEQLVAQAGTKPGIELLSAWLATDPAGAAAYVAEQAEAGNAGVLQALLRHQETGKSILLDLDLTNQSVEFQDAVLFLLRVWNLPDYAAFEPVFSQLAAGSDPRIRLRAIGYLVRIDKASGEQLAELQEAVRSDTENLDAAIEGAKISRSAALASAFIPRVKDTPLGEADPQAPLNRQSFLGAYALAYIPGQDAQVIRSNLLEAAHPDVRWQARFGELMQGNPGLFNKASLEEGIMNNSLLKCLTPFEAFDPELLQWYEKALAQAGEPMRFQLCSQLSRYNEHASDPRLRKLVLDLLDDESSLVRGQAWLLAAQFGYGGRRVEAADLLATDTEQAPVKAAAACYLLSVPGAAQGTGS